MYGNNNGDAISWAGIKVENFYTIFETLIYFDLFSLKFQSMTQINCNLLKKIGKM